MKLRKLQCSSCSAPLEVTVAADRATCEYCGNEGLLGPQAAAPDPRPSPVRALDQEWLQARERLTRSVRGDTLSVPSVVGSVVVGVVMLGFGVVWISMATGMGAPGMFPMFGVLWMVLVGAGMVRAVARARRFRDARDRYRDQRRSLLGD